MFKKRFINPHIGDIRRTMWHAILWKMGYYDDPVPDSPPPKDFVFPFPKKEINKDEPYAAWINHSSFLVSIEGISFLTDPIWNKRCFPLIGPKRHHLPGIKIEDLPRIDYVLLSHDHYDHFDKKTVRELFKRFPEIVWLVPTGMKIQLEKLGIKNILELSWWESTNLGSSKHPHLELKATHVPTQHFSGRSATNVNETLWGGWVIECKGKQSKAFYFVGDTGYNPHDFKKIGENWKGFDLSLIPIGSYSPRKFMSPVHVEPKDALRIHLEVQSKRSIGMHWKTFRLSDEPMDSPPYVLLKALQEKNIDPSTFFVLEPGYEVNW